MSKCSTCQTRRAPCFSDQEFKLAVLRTGNCDFYEADLSQLEKHEAKASLEAEAAGLPAQSLNKD